jgi:hypothetical protein
MSLPDSGSLEALSLAELRGLVGVPIAEVRRLQLDNANPAGQGGGAAGGDHELADREAGAAR